MQAVFPTFTGNRCLMLPYIQGRPETVPSYIRAGYEKLLEDLVLEDGQLGHLTIDESFVEAGSAQRAFRARHGRALHTEVGRRPDKLYAWGGGGWAGRDDVLLSRDTRILLSSSLSGSTAVWDAEEENTTSDGDIGHLADKYSMDSARILSSGEVAEIGILTPHESLPVKEDVARQFIRIVGKGVSGSAPYFTINPFIQH